MNVNATNPVGPVSGQRFASRPTSAGFSVAVPSEGGEAAAAARPASAAGIGSIDALLTMQDINGPSERRRKAVRRGRQILDRLDEVKMALLEGAPSPAALDHLIAAVRQERAATDDLRLEALLDEIETRAAVELAKWEVAKPAT